MVKISQGTRTNLDIVRKSLICIYNQAFDEWHKDRTEDGHCRFGTKKYKQMKKAEKAMNAITDILTSF